MHDLNKSIRVNNSTPSNLRQQMSYGGGGPGGGGGPPGSGQGGGGGGGPSPMPGYSTASRLPPPHNSMQQKGNHSRYHDDYMMQSHYEPHPHQQQQRPPPHPHAQPPPPQPPPHPQQQQQGQPQPSGGGGGGGGGGQQQAPPQVPVQQIACKKNLQKMMGVSPSDIDKYSRIFFPISFISFNLMYWIIYMHVSDEVAEDLVMLHPT